jgi:LuxR family transcriptional regulator, maltose regulon positive regulatory protein
LNPVDDSAARTRSVPGRTWKEISSTLIARKLSIPPVQEDLVDRPHLYRVLDTGTRDGMVVVAAPAGFGKTQFVAGWARSDRASGTAVAWLGLDVEDRDPARFLLYAVVAVTSRAGVADLPAAFEPLPPLSPVNEDYLASVAAALSTLEQHVVLVLDNFHEVIGSETERVLKRIVRFPPPRWGLVVLTRVQPELGLERVRLSGDLTEISAGDLAFTAEETGRLLDAHGMAVTDPSVQRLQEQTQGWPAGIRLLQASVATSTKTRRYVAESTEKSGLVLEYLRSEVFDPLSAETKDFTLRTCAVDRICGALADSLTGGHDGARRLADLRRANLFLDAEEGGVWYRWHPLFAEMLRSVLHAEDRELEQRQHLAAGQWLLQEGYACESVRQSLAGGDTEAAATVLRECWPSLLAVSGPSRLREVLEEFDEATRISDPDLAAACGFVHSAEGDLDEGRRLVTRALEPAVELSPQRRVRVELMATVAVLRAVSMTGSDGEVYRRALARLHVGSRRGRVAHGLEGRVRHALLLYELGAFETSTLLWEEGRSHLGEALCEAGILELPYLQFACAAQLVGHDLHDGNLEKGRERGRAVLTWAQEGGWTSDRSLVAVQLGLAGIAFLCDDLDEARAHLREADSLVKPADTLSRFNISFLGELTDCASGEVREARQQLLTLQGHIRNSDAAPWLHTLGQAAEACQLTCEAECDRSLELMKATSKNADRVSTFRPHPVFHAELLIRAGRVAEGRAILSPWLRSSTPTPVRVAALVTDALGAAAAGSHEEALAEMDRALEAARDEPLIHPFVAPGRAAQPLLQELLDRGTRHERLALEVLAHMSPSAAKCASGRSPHFVEPLSERELVVLRRLPGTRTNEQIAAELHVSLNTVRSHIKSINRKLSTGSRRESVRRARDLGML